MKFLKILLFTLIISFSSFAFCEELNYYINQNYNVPTISFRYYGVRHNLKLAREDCEDYARTFIPNAKCGKLKSMFHDNVNFWILTFELKFQE